MFYDNYLKKLYQYSIKFKNKYIKNIKTINITIPMSTIKNIKGFYKNTFLANFTFHTSLKIYTPTFHHTIIIL